MWRMRAKVGGGVGGGVDADRSLSAALCSLSPGDQTDTDRGYLRKVGQDGETDQLLMKVLFLFGFS